MKRFLFILLFIANGLYSSEFIDIALKDYIKIVSKQENITIVIDKSIDSNYSIFLSSKLSSSIYIDVLKTILKNNGLTIKFRKNHYFITKVLDNTAVKSKVFIYKFNFLNDSDINSLMKIYSYKFEYVKSLKTVFIDCTLNQYKQLIKAFNKLDVLPQQKKLKITILDTNLSKIKEYGSQNNLKIKSNDSFFFNLLAYPFSATNILTSSDKSSFTSFIKFMNSKEYTNILSSPTISIFDNKKSLFEVVKNIPFETGKTISNDDLTKTTTSTQYKDVGLKLVVTPIINNNHAFIDLSLTIENILTASKTPTTSKRHFNQYLSLNVGEIFVLNGINQSETFLTKSNTPFLSDIPYLGWLFKSEFNNIKESNLTILIELIDNTNFKVQAIKETKKDRKILSEHQKKVNQILGINKIN